MTHYSGPVVAPIDSYEAFKNAVNGNSFDFDGVAGCQCVDLAKLLNFNLGFTSPYWNTGGTGSAYGGWTVLSARVFNTGTQYTWITDVSLIKKGDMIVIDRFSGNDYGHVGFADQDYNYTNNIRMLSQNNGGIPAPGGGTTVNIANYPLTHFLGAFRLTRWQESYTRTRSHFKWALYANKLRNKY